MKPSIQATPKATPRGPHIAADHGSSNGFVPEASGREEAEGARGRALLTTSAEAVQHLDAQRVLALQSALQHGTTYGHWLTPRHWAPAGADKTRLNLDMRRRIIHFLPEHHQRWVQAADQARSLVQNAVQAGEISALPTTTSPVHRILDGAVLVFTRYLVLLRMGPAGLGRKGGGASLDPSNVANIGYNYMALMLALGASFWLAKISLESSSEDSATVEIPPNLEYLRFIQIEDLEQVTSHQRNNLRTEAERMRMFADRGYWSDVPAFCDAPTPITNVSGPALPSQKQRTVDAHLPLPDGYVSEMGRYSLWLIQDLGPSLMKAAEEIRAIWQRTDILGLTPRQVLHLRRRDLEAFLSRYIWRDGRDHIIDAPPCKLRFSQQGKNSNLSKNRLKTRIEDLDDLNDLDGEGGDDCSAAEPLSAVEWPPRTFGDVMGLLYNLQMAHLFVVNLSTGARKSETLNLKRSCVERAKDGLPYATGRTYKLVQRHDGELRDWVLPDLAVKALEQQARLVGLTETIGPMLPVRPSDGMVLSPVDAATHLWARISASSESDRTEPLFGIGKALVSYARALDMDTAPGGQNFRSHRFRKTVARLVALALTQAPKILMDVFGHKSIEMTLYYILADKDLQSDIEKVSRELRVMRAKEAVDKMVADEQAQVNRPSLGSYGGPAALMVHRAIEVQKDRLHHRGEEWGAESAVELAEILTLGGKAWQLVRPGVICTKFPATESGPCNKSKGRPEPSRCQSHCKHRLEEGFLREDVEGALRDSIEAYNEAGASGEYLMQESWAGQIRAHIGRFEDLRVKWMKDPTVQRVVEKPNDDGAPT